MEYLSVIVAAIGAFMWGAIWYSTLAKQWLAATGLTEERRAQAGMMPFVIAFISCVLVAGMMRHVFASSGIDTGYKGLVSGLGMGLFIAAPWLATCYSFGMRSQRLILIDIGYIAGGAAIIGLILGLF